MARGLGPAVDEACSCSLFPAAVCACLCQDRQHGPPTEEDASPLAADGNGLPLGQQAGSPRPRSSLAASHGSLTALPSWGLRLTAPPFSLRQGRGGDGSTYRALGTASACAHQPHHTRPRDAGHGPTHPPITVELGPSSPRPPAAGRAEPGVAVPSAGGALALSRNLPLITSNSLQLLLRARRGRKRRFSALPRSAPPSSEQ